MSDEPVEKPEAPPSERTRQAVAADQTAIENIPMVGPIASAVLGLGMSPVLTRRRDQWEQEVCDAIGRLHSDLGVVIERLSSNDAFVDVYLLAAQTAARTSAREKLDALRNAVLNAAVSDQVERPRQQAFVHLVDRFTPTHLRALSVFDDVTTWYQTHDLPLPGTDGGPPATLLDGILGEALPGLRSDPEFCKFVVHDLTSTGLLQPLAVFSAAGGLTAAPIRTEVSQLTGLGKEFLKYISSPLDGPNTPRPATS